MERQIPEKFYVREAIPGLYFRADDSRRRQIISDVVGAFQFYHDPHCEYDGWCVLPFIDQEPKGTPSVGSTTLYMPGSVDRDANGQVRGGTGFFNHDRTSERFSREIYAIKDENVPKKPDEWFVLEPAVPSDEVFV